MTRHLPSTLALLALGATLALPAHAVTLTQWNFNSPTPDGATATGTTAPSFGSGTASLLGTTATFATGNPGDPAANDNSGWNTTGYPALSTGDKTEGVRFAVSTLGFQDVSISWFQRHSNTASKYSQFQVALDGASFVDFGAPFVAATGDTWFARSVDLSTLAGADDNAAFAFRIVATFAPGTTSYVASNPSNTYATTGTQRFDLVTVSALAPIPEPGTWALLLAGLAAVGGAARRRTA